MTLPYTSVLVIEEHPLLREAICSAIESEPDLRVIRPDITRRVAVAIPGKHDMLFYPDRPDIILFAFGNPSREELECLKKIQASLPGIPILALTCNEVPDQDQAALDNGAHAVLTKAASRAELIQALYAIRLEIETSVSKTE